MDKYDKRDTPVLFFSSRLDWAGTKTMEKKGERGLVKCGNAMAKIEYYVENENRIIWEIETR